MNAMKTLSGIILSVMMGSAAQWHVLSRTGTERLLEVQFSDSLHGWALAERSLFRTTDRGRTWSVERSIADTSFGGLAVIDSGHVFVSYGKSYWTPRYVWWYVWVDEYVNGFWVRRFFDLDGPCEYTLYAGRFAVLDSMHLWHLGWRGYRSVAVRTRDGGAGWELFTPWGYLGARYDASFVDTLTGWAVWGAIAMTTNAGGSWSTLTVDVGARRVQMLDALNGWVLSTSGLMHTTDGGVSWDTAVAESGLTAMRFCNPQHGVAMGLSGTILRTTDSGATWIRDTAESSFDLYAVCMLGSAHAWAVGDSGIVLGMGDWAMPGVEEQVRTLTRPLELAGVWPNPCRGTLWVECRGSAGSIMVYDDCGRPVRGAQCSSDKVEKLDLRGLPAGVYFARSSSSPRASVRFVLLR